MSIWLSKKELKKLAPAETAACESPVPTRVISNGEFNPLPQTDKQKLQSRMLRPNGPRH